MAGQTLGQLFIQGGQPAEAAPQHHHLGIDHRDGGGEPGGQDLQPAVDGRERRGFPGLGTGDYLVAAGALAVAGSFVGRTQAGFWAELVAGTLMATFGLLVVRFPNSDARVVALLAAR